MFLVIALFLGLAFLAIIFPKVTHVTLMLVSIGTVAGIAVYFAAGSIAQYVGY